MTHNAVSLFAKSPLIGQKGIYMLNVGKIEEGFVLDHIKAGTSLSIYRHLQLDKLDCTVAIIKNARSNKMGKKDILKVECDVDMMDLDVLAFIDHNITVNIIKNGEIVEKGLPQIYVHSDEKQEIYRCKYCEDKFDRRSL